VIPLFVVLRFSQQFSRIVVYLGTELAGMNLGQIRRFIVRPDLRTRLADVTGALTQKWLDIVDTDPRLTEAKLLRSDDIILEIDSSADVLHARNNAGKTYLCSTDYTVVHEVGSNDDNPFHLLQNDNRYVFTRSENATNKWRLTVRDPHLSSQ
jgi:hypothetical protein